MRMRRKQFPTHMLATRPQKRSGWLAIMFGPGWMPFTMKAARAIVTLPLGVLQAPPEAPGAVRFVPALDTKRAALAGLAFGPVLKLSLRFRKAFWDELDGGKYQDAAFFHSAQTPFQHQMDELKMAEDIVDSIEIPNRGR